MDEPENPGSGCSCPNLLSFRVGRSGVGSGAYNARVKSRGVRGTVLGAVVVASTLGLSGCMPFACSTIGYLYDGPAIVEFTAPLADGATVSACFGEECQPAEVTRDADGRWVVPQDIPYLSDFRMPPGEIRDLRVVVTGSSGTVISDEVHEIPVSVERQGFLGQCPGPYEFAPVTVELPN